MTQFSSCPISKKILSHPDFKQGLIIKNKKIMEVVNINLFSNYIFEANLEFQGYTDIFNSVYSGFTFTPETGIIKIIDTFFVDQSGTYTASGLQTGILQDEIITKISAGYEHSLYIHPFYKTYFGLGNNNNNRIGSGSQNVNNVVEIEAGTTHSLLLLTNEKITGFGNNIDGRVAGIPEILNTGGWSNTPVGKLTGVKKISTYNSFSLAFLGDNGVTGWGNNLFNQITPFQNKILYLSGIKDIKAGGAHGFILYNNGTLTGWGNTGTGNWINPAGWQYLSNVKEINLGENHSLALLNNNVVTGWGLNNYGQATGGNNLTGVKNVSAGNNFSLALLNNNTITGWGDNTYNQALGGNNLINVSGIYAGGNYGIAILNDGKITGWGDNFYNQYILYNPKIYSGDIIYDTTKYLKQGDIRMIGGDYNVGPPIGFRNITFAGTYTGFARFNDYFYDPISETLSFVKDIFYKVEGIEILSVPLNVLNSTSNNQNLPTKDGILINLSSLSGYQTTTVSTIVYGFIRNVPLKRLQISGYSFLTGTISGIGSGIINFNKLVSGLPTVAYTNQISGYKNASGLLNFENTELGDFIILNNDFTGSNVAFIYQTGDQFVAPGFFRSAEDLNNIINSGSNDYGIKSTYIPRFLYNKKTFITGNTLGLGNPNNDFFGASTSLSSAGNVLAVGAHLADTNAVNDAGAVYLFTGVGNSWVQTARLTGNTLGLGNPASDRFGYSTSLSSLGNVLAVGAYSADTNAVNDAGAVYIFSGGGNSWVQTARLTGDTLGLGNPAGDQFGISTSLNSAGNVLAVGAHLADTNAVNSAGAVYLFTGVGNSWAQAARLTGNTLGLGNPDGDLFGISTSLNSDGNVLAVGAYNADTTGVSAGAVYLFTGSGSSWVQTARLTGNTLGLGNPASDNFGWSTSLNSDGNVLSVGAYSADTNAVNDAGAVYIFTGVGNSWVQTARLTGNTLGLGNPANDNFGWSTSLNSAGNVLAVGAYRADINAVNDAGAVYIFTGGGNSWSQILIFTGDDTKYNPIGGESFGAAVSLNNNGDALFAGAYGATIDGLGNAGYVNYINLKERLMLESLISGELGNNFRIISQGSRNAPFLENEFFTGGQNFNVQITPLSGVIFTGNLTTGMFITGYFEKLITGTIEKEITGLLGYRPFTGLWDLYELNDLSFTNIKNTGYFNESGIFTNYTGFSTNLVNIKRFAVSYTNQPDFQSTDLALLNINLNSGLSGFSYNIILTGNTELNTPIIPPTGDRFGVN